MRPGSCLAWATGCKESGRFARPPLKAVLPDRLRRCWRGKTAKLLDEAAPEAAASRQSAMRREGRVTAESNARQVHNLVLSAGVGEAIAQV